MNSQLVKAEDLAFGRWPEILTAAGMSPDYLTGRGVPCPLCGGTDRFQWVQKKYGGVYVCRHCSDGKYKSGMDLLMQHLGEDFRGAANHVRGYFGVSTAEEARKFVERHPIVIPQNTATDHSSAVNRMQRQWLASKPVMPGDPVDLYLRRRVPGLELIPSEIQCHPALEYWDSSGKRPLLTGKFPAMLVRGFDPEGNWVQLHKTYLTRDGHKADVEHPKKTDIGVGANSYAFRLGEPKGGVLGTAEGIETALASSVMFGVTVWPCHSSSVLANFRVPPALRQDVDRVWIFADNDPVHKGRRAGHKAASDLSAQLRKDGVRNLIRIPARTGQDFDDALVER